MRRVVRLLVIGTCLSLAVLIAVQATVAHDASTRSTKRQRALDDELQRWTPQVLADHRRWQGHSLFAAHDGGNAAELLSMAVAWPGRAAPHAIPDRLIEQFRDAGAEWLTRSDIDVSPFDLTWMRTLSTFGYWDVETTPSPLVRRPFRLGEAEPRYIDARGLARVRLRQGVERNEVPQAARDVRELARLLLSTERVTGEMFAISLLTLEREAVDEAARRGQSVDACKPLSSDEVQSLKRALWSANLWSGLYDAPSVESAADFPTIGRCAALSELSTPLAFRPWAGSAFSQRYERLNERLTSSQCRLTRLRRAWKADGEGELRSLQDVCEVSGEPCDLDDSMAWVPFTRDFVGYALTVSGSTDWLRPYREPSPAAD